MFLRRLRLVYVWFLNVSSISINIALARMEQTIDDHARPVTFNIEFIKEDGAIRTMRAQRHVKNGAHVSPASNEKARFKYRLKEKNSILLFDADEKKYRTVRVDRIIRFNQMNVIH